VPDLPDRLVEALRDQYAFQHELGRGGIATVRHMRAGLQPLGAITLAFALATCPAATASAQDVTLVHGARWDLGLGRRVVEVAGATWLGFVTEDGDPAVVVYGTDGSREIHVLATGVDSIPSAPPVLVALDAGRVLTFLARPGQDAIAVHEAMPASGTVSWKAARQIRPSPPPTPENRARAIAFERPIPVWTYVGAVPLVLPGSSRAALVWRRQPWGGVWISFSEDGGGTWTTGRQLFMPAPRGWPRRPVVALAADGDRHIHFAVTDTRVSASTTNSVYYFSFDGTVFSRVDGTVIGGLDSLPLRFDQVNVLFDGVAEGLPGGLEDIAVTDDGTPVALYVRHADTPQYRYVTWNGFRWIDRSLAAACLPNETPSGIDEEERPFTVGGAVLDPADPRIAYVSTPTNSSCAIDRMFTPDGGDTWSSERLTGGLNGHAFQPQAASGSERYTTLVWLRGPVDGGDAGFDVRARRLDRTPYSAALERDEIVKVMQAVADWQLRVPVREAPRGFPIGALDAGLLALGQLPGAEAYERAVMQAADTNDWKLNDRGNLQQRYNPLNHVHGQIYLDLYRKYRRPEMIHDVTALGDEMLGMPFDGSLELRREDIEGIDERGWAFEDALFMTPTLLVRLAAVTEARRYLDLMDRLWWKTTDYLYDTQEHLFHRDSRYFDMPLANRFWSRGNGWVLAGLARVYPYLPQDYPTRARYAELFKVMAGRIAGLQADDGYWRSSLLEPETTPTPETSGTGFFVFALAWGVNAGLLDETEYLPVVRRGWEALVRAVDVNGKLGWSQTADIEPRASRAGWSEPFAVGAFLLAGAELYELAGRREASR